MATVSKMLEKVLGDIFDDACDIEDAEARAKARSEFIFHMTDWEDELQRLARLYEDPECFSEQEAKDTIAATLYHATGHLIAAARLYDYVPDPFATDLKKE